MTDMTVADIKAKLTALDIPFKSKAKKDELLALLPAENDDPEQAAADAHDEWVRDNGIVEDAPVEQAESKPKVMGLHYRGRGMGAKHYRLISAIQNGVTKPGERKSFRDAAPMPNSERVQKYARQQQLNNPDPFTHGCPVLTHNQMRRVRKHSTPGDNLFILTDKQNADTTGKSLLARTPAGERIYFRFASV